MREALESVDGVEACEIDFDAKTATVKLNGDVDLEKLAKSVESGGFEAKIKQ